METARRVNQYPDQIFRYAMATHRAEHDPTTALRLAPLVFVRPGELRGARWEGFALAAGVEPVVVLEQAGERA